MSVASDVNSSRDAGPKGNPCPRCGKPLTDAAGLGWCRACGYCRSLEEAQATLPEQQQAAATKPSMGGLVELGQAVGGLPRWVWIMLVGVVGFAGFTVLPGRQLPPNSLDRALWSACQIGVGLGMIFLAQFVALIRIAPHDAKFGIKDAVLPFRLWGLVARRMPENSFSAWFGAWGLTLIVSAFIFVGGMSYWMKYINDPKPGKNQSHSASRR